MNRKAQALIISLWILAILTVLAVSIGHRVSMALRLSRYQRDSFKALYLARAGINRAIIEIVKNDTLDTDSLKDKWVDNQEIFGAITFGDDKTGFATVGYNIIDVNNEPRTVYGVIDEERKINLNSATYFVLLELLNTARAVNSEETANNICAWRGDTGAVVPVDYYKGLGYENKSQGFSNIEELALVKGIDDEIYKSIRELITVYPLGSGGAKVNINTVEHKVLDVLIRGCIAKLRKAQVTISASPENLLNEILIYRQNNIFSDLNLESVLNLSGPDRSDFINIINELKSLIGVTSQNFKVIATGNIINGAFSRSVDCVFDRKNNRIVYWHEN